jgi:hypothetical protein
MNRVHARRMTWGRALAILLAGSFVAAGCSGGSTPRQWLGSLAPGGASTEQVFFAGFDGLLVRDDPKSSANVVGRLDLHEKVFRSHVTDGYAHVRAADGSPVGWVVNAKLLWRLPPEHAGPTAEQSAPAEAAEVPSEAASEATPAPPATEQTTAPQPPKPRSGASLLDPY